jgi:hypothetical protein
MIPGRHKAVRITRGGGAPPHDGRHLGFVPQREGALPPKRACPFRNGRSTGRKQRPRWSAARSITAHAVRTVAGTRCRRRARARHGRPLISGRGGMRFRQVRRYARPNAALPDGGERATGRDRTLRPRGPEPPRQTRTPGGVRMPWRGIPGSPTRRAQAPWGAGPRTGRDARGGVLSHRHRRIGWDQQPLRTRRLCRESRIEEPSGSRKARSEPANGPTGGKP